MKYVIAILMMLAWPVHAAPILNITNEVISLDYSLDGLEQTAVYRTTVTNTGDSRGTFDLLASMLPAAGVIRVLSGAAEYGGGERMTGVLTSEFNTTVRFIEGERLGAGRSESFIITVNYSVDQANLADAPKCSDHGDFINEGMNQVTTLQTGDVSDQRNAKACVDAYVSTDPVIVLCSSVNISLSQILCTLSE